MLHYDIVVKIPDKTKIFKQNDNKYVYHIVSSEYDANRKFNIDKRVCIGRVCKDNPLNMNPNENFKKFYSIIDFKEASNIVISDTMSIGQAIALEKINDELGLNQLINFTFNNKADLVKSLILYYIDNQSSVIQLFNKWAFKNYHYTAHTPSQATFSNLFNHHITSSMINEFILQWTELAISHNENNRKVLLSIDSTNMNVSSSSVQLAEFGKPKDNEHLAQINLAYALNQITGLPFYYDLYPGSIPDVSQCKLMVTKAQEYGLDDICFVMDRGYFSTQNIDFMIKNKHNFIIMALTSLKFYKELFRNYGDKIKNNAHFYIRKHELFGVKINCSPIESIKEELFAYFYYNDDMANNERRAYNDKVNRMIESLSNVKQWNADLENTYGSYLSVTVDKKNNVLDININTEKQQLIYDQAGYFWVLSTLDDDPTNIIDIYRKRDIIEKTFRALKSNLDSDKYFARNNHSLSSKVLINFITSITRAQLAYKCRSFLGKHRDENVNTIMAELSKIEISKFNTTYIRKYALTKKQKDILKCLDIDEKYIENFVNNVNLSFSNINR